MVGGCWLRGRVLGWRWCLGVLWGWGGACWDGEQHLVLVIWWWEGQDGRWGLDEVNWGWCGEMQLLLKVEDWGWGGEGRMWFWCWKKHWDLVMDEVGKWDGKRHWAVNRVWDGDGDQLWDVDQLGHRNLVGHRSVHHHNLLNEAFHETLNHVRGCGRRG